ncbi:hypothetical protein FisN_10Lh175 [Fistulifera solaris]|uniref:DRBM domain-containing protein n=1 Tax=Fistulifera solaris TaxID=1519565 RepID=A0A1Z5JU77_FISSO|nr:hypothetical protein FisN_10Lh175 [Fistulifera solaris]|eukprot:GAX17311.1 hypothetical protein FisN_10Lh175 [Fistulifera solaris]
MSNRNDDDIRSDEEPKAEAANKKIKQETQADGLPPAAQPRLANEPIPAFSEDSSNLHLPQPPVNQYPAQIAYNPLGLFVPSQFPFIPQPAYHVPHNLPYPVHPPPPPFHLPQQPQYPSPPASIQYYEARMRDHAAAYASAAAGAAWAAAQMAAAAADFAAQGQMPLFRNGEHPPFYPPYQPPPFIPSEHHDPQQPDAQYESSSDPPHRRKRRPRLDDVPGRISTKQHRDRIRRGEDSSSNSSCSTFVRKSKKKDRSDESMLGKTAVAALYEWCSRRNHLPSFVLQQITPTHFHCVVTLEDDVEWGHGQGGNKGAAKKEAARQALQSLCPTVVFDETSGFVIALRNAVEDLAPHLAKQLAIDATDDNISSTTDFSEDENDFWKSGQGATILSNLLFTTIQIDPRIKESVPVFTYQIMPVVQHHPLKRKTTTSDVSRGRFTCIAELKVYHDEGSEDVLQAKGVGTSKREARHMACAALLVKLFPECDGNFAKVKEAAEAARTRYKSTRLNSRGPPFPESFVSGFQRVLDHNDLPQTAAVRVSTRRKQLDILVEKALHSYHDGSNAEDEKLLLQRAEPQDLTLIKKVLLSDEDVRTLNFLKLWSSSSIVLLLCKDACFQDPLGCAVLTLGFNFHDGQLLRIQHLSTESRLTRERFIERLRGFANSMNYTLVNDEKDKCKNATSVKLESAQIFVQHQLRLRLRTTTSVSHTLQSVQEEEENSDDSEKRPAAKVVSTNPSKRSRVV